MAAAPIYPGEVARRADPRIGVTTVLIDATAPGAPVVRIVGLADGAELYTYRWTTLCATHDDADGWSRREDAEEMLPSPEEWCAGCRAAAGLDEFGEPRPEGTRQR